MEIDSPKLRGIIISQFDSKGLPALETASEDKPLKFNRAFWILAISVAVIQIYHLILRSFFGLGIFEEPSNDYLFHAEWSGLLWYAAITAIVLMELDSHGAKNLETLDLSWKSKKETWTSTLAYSGIVVGCILLFNLIFPSDERISADATTDVIVMTIISVTLAAPICEEIWFRGYLYQAMFAQFKRKNERIIVNAMLFAGGHVLLLGFFLGAEVPYYIFIVGILLAKLYEESRSVIPGIIVHMVNNTTVAVLEIFELNDPFGFYK